MNKTLITTVTCLLASLGALHAQQRNLTAFRPAVANGTQAFLVEAAGATAGSFVGFGAVYLAANDCDDEGLDCLEKAGVGLATSTLAAALGAQIAGKLADTQPSGWGAAVGAIAGAAAGVGMWHLVKEEWNITTSNTAGILTYAVSQGILTAVGSRIGSNLRRE